MAGKVLFVDDEPNVLDAIRRQMRNKVLLDTATSGEEGLQKFREDDAFTVVVSDMRMPNMNGAEFLAEIRKLNADCVRMVLSGQAELEATIEAVNEGQIFRFLTKPCSTESLVSALDAAMEHHRLVLAERELLEKTLGGAIKMLTEIIGITNPVAFARASRIQRYAQEIVEAVGLEFDWQLKLATMLSQLGCITLPGDTLSRIYSGQEVNGEEKTLYWSHPLLAGELLKSVPRLEGVAEIISLHTEDIAVDDLPEDISEWDEKLLARAVLRAATELDDLVMGGTESSQAIEQLQKNEKILPEHIRNALEKVTIIRGQSEKKLVKAAELEVGMVVDEDVMSSNGMRLLLGGHEVSQTILVRLNSIARGIGIVEPIRVNVYR